MNKKFLSAALAISLLGMCKIGFNNSALAVPPGDDVIQIRNQIFRLNVEYKSSCINGQLIQSVAPVENWRTRMLDLFNRLPLENRSPTFVQIAKIRGLDIDLKKISDFSEIGSYTLPVK